MKIMAKNWDWKFENGEEIGCKFWKRPKIEQNVKKISKRKLQTLSTGKKWSKSVVIFKICRQFLAHFQIVSPNFLPAWSWRSWHHAIVWFASNIAGRLAGHGRSSEHVGENEMSLLTRGEQANVVRGDDLKVRPTEWIDYIRLEMSNFSAIFSLHHAWQRMCETFKFTGKQLGCFWVFLKFTWCTGRLAVPLSKKKYSEIRQFGNSNLKGQLGCFSIGAKGRNHCGLEGGGWWDFCEQIQISPPNSSCAQTRAVRKQELCADAAVANKCMSLLICSAMHPRLAHVSI